VSEKPKRPAVEPGQAWHVMGGRLLVVLTLRPLGGLMWEALVLESDWWPVGTLNAWPIGSTASLWERLA